MFLLFSVGSTRKEPSFEVSSPSFVDQLSLSSADDIPPPDYEVTPPLRRQVTPPLSRVASMLVLVLVHATSVPPVLRWRSLSFLRERESWLVQGSEGDEQYRTG